MYIRVVRREGPQLSLIDLPGITHNASKMKDIYEAGTGVQNPKDHKQICPLQDVYLIFPDFRPAGLATDPELKNRASWLFTRASGH